MVRVNHDGQALEVATYGSTVSGILEQLGISTEGDLRISQSLDSATYDGMVIDVVALTYETVEYVRSEPYQTIYCTDSTLAPGEEQVLTPGQEGSVHCTARITRENGTEVSRTVTQERGSLRPGKRRSGPGHRPPSKEQEGAGRAYAPAVEASEPDRSAATSQAEGSGEAVRETEPEPASTTPATEPAPLRQHLHHASGEVLTYSQKLSVEATAYSCEGYAGTTATGTTARYGAIAVDPSVIPYGTRMYIVSDDGSYIYGYATAEDCGGAIQGYMIDLYFDTPGRMLRLWPPDLHRVYSGLTSRQGWFMSLKRVTYLISPRRGAPGLPGEAKGASAPVRKQYLLPSCFWCKFSLQIRRSSGKIQGKGGFFMMDLCNAQEVKGLLARHGFRFSKAKGQNFLIAAWVPQRIAEESGIDRGCGVLEVGPGIGP